jgi:sulfide:quinone oxidoreductase
MTEPTSSHVVIAGGGVAALETLMALRDLAGDRVAITLIAPERTFTFRPMKVAEPFHLGHAREYELADVARDHRARFIHDSVAEVEPHEQVVRCGTGVHVPFDHLVLATGAKAGPAFRHALTFGEDPAEKRLHGLLADLEQGYVKSVAFVVPGGASWTLPLYEIALMTARQAWNMGMERVEFTLVTPEERPLAIFGGPASDAVAQMLSTEGIEFVGSSYPDVQHGFVVADPSGRRIDADRVVSLPVLDGRRLTGVPSDDGGFVPVDAHGRVPGLSGVYAAGDGTNFPIKQGGLATQQADAVAEAIAAEAGADVEPEPFRPVLRGMLLTGGDDRYLRHTIAGGDGEGEVSGHALWWPPTKIAGRYLSAYLHHRDDDRAIEEIRGGHIEVDLPLDAHATAGHS